MRETQPDPYHSTPEPHLQAHKIRAGTAHQTPEPLGFHLLTDQSAHYMTCPQVLSQRPPAVRLFVAR